MRTPTDKEIAQFLQENGHATSDSFGEQELVQFFHKVGVPELDKEISNTGFACDFFNDVPTLGLKL